MFKRIVMTLAVCLCCHALWAQQQAGDTISGKTHGLGEVEVSARRASESVVASKPVQQMSQQEIELLGLENLADAVKKFAGVNVRDYGGLGGMKTVSIRNLGAHHTGVTYDGIAIGNTQAGQVDIGRFGLENVELVSLNVGDANDWLQAARSYASAGVLGMTTERPRLSAEKPWMARVRVSVGQWGYVKPSLALWSRLGERTLVGLNGSFLHSDGGYPFTLTNASVKTDEKRQNTDMEAWQGEANVMHTFADSSSLDMKAYWHYSERGLPGSVILYASHSDERMWDEDVFAQATYRRSFGEKWQLVGRAKFTHSWTRYEDPGTEMTGGTRIDVDRQDEWYGSAVLGWMPLKGLKVSLAQDIIYNTLRSNIPIYNNTGYPYPKRLTSLTALSANYSWQRLKASANVVATYAKERVETMDDPDDRKQLSPTASLSYRLLNDESLYLRAMMKSTFRLPTFNDLYYRRMGNPLLRPEKARMFDLGVTWHRNYSGVLRYVSVTLDGYYNHVHDKIVAFPSTYIWRMVNYGKVHIWGAEATAAAEMALARRVNLTACLAYSYQSAKNMTDPQTQLYKQQLPYTPWHNGNLALTLTNPWVNVGYNITFCGKRYSMDQNKPEYKIDAYWLHDLTLSHEFALRSMRLGVSLAAMNLFDEQYDIIKYYPMPGRSFRLTATLHL